MTLAPISIEEKFLGIVKSLAVHATLLLLFWTSVQVAELPFFNEDPVVMVKSSVRVDVVAMPKLTLKEIKELVKVNQAPAIMGEKVAPKEVIDPTVGNEKAPVLQEEKLKKDKSFDDFLNKLSEKKLAVEKKVKAGNPDAQLKASEQDKIQELLHMGNKLSKGLVAFGESEGEEVQGELVEYGTSVIEKIRPFWRLPTYLLDKNLKCGIQVYIDTQGQIVRTFIREASGTAEYDQKAVASILEAAPFDVPSASIAEKLRKGALVIGFPL